AGSLRKAILDSNSGILFDTIKFAIPGAGLHTIIPPAPLPTITGSVIIDGWSQGGVGYTGPPVIEIDGASAGVASVGLTITAGHTRVKGLVINRFALSGISLLSDGNFIQGNYIGTDTGGSVSSPNLSGITISAGANNTIGGTTASARNIISGNTQN